MTQQTRGPQREKSLAGNDFAGAGIQFAVAIIVFIFLGSWIDKHYGTGPIGILAGLAIGGGGGFYSMYRKISAFQKEDDERRREKRKTTSNE